MSDCLYGQFVCFSLRMAVMAIAYNYSSAQENVKNNIICIAVILTYQSTIYINSNMALSSVSND